METQLNLDVLRETPIDEEWILKYPPARVGSEILACKFESIDISSDMIALVIEDADSWIDRYAPSVDYTRCIDIGAVAVSWGVLAISPVWNRIPDFYFDKPHIDMVKYDRYGRNLCRLPFH